MILQIKEMRVFVDANILVSVLNKEYPLFSDAARILSLNDKSPFEIYTSPICLSIAWYFSEKKSGQSLARKKMIILCENIRISGIEEAGVKQTVANKKIHDFEDGLEYYSAMQSGCETIITEDTSDFCFSEIEVMRCVDFLRRYVYK